MIGGSILQTFATLEVLEVDIVGWWREKGGGVIERKKMFPLFPFCFICLFIFLIFNSSLLHQRGTSTICGHVNYCHVLFFSAIVYISQLKHLWNTGGGLRVSVCIVIWIHWGQFVSSSQSLSKTTIIKTWFIPSTPTLCLCLYSRRPYLVCEAQKKKKNRGSLDGSQEYGQFDRNVLGLCLHSTI